MGFLTKEGLQNLTNKLVQGDAIKVASHRGKNVKEVIDNIQRECENVALPNTMNLENRINEFKVGKSRDVDVSGDVEEGKIEVGLSGRTYQNLVKENSKYTQELNTKNHTGYIEPNFTLKPTGTYTLFFKVSNLVKSGNARVNCVFRGNDNDNTYGQFAGVDVVEDGLNRKMFTLKNGLKNFLIGISASANKNNPTFTIGDIMILEGDHTQTPIEELPKYFEGIKSSFEDGVVDVEVQGKNLFNGQLNQWSGHASVVADNLYQVGGDRAWKGGRFLIDKPLEVGKKYTISFDIENVQGNNVNFIFYEVKPYKVFSANIKHFTFTFTCEECEKPSFIICSHNGEGMINVSNIQITKTPHELPYEPYYKKKISFNIEEPLRSLPNEICDEIRNNNGQWELVRRVGKTILDGSETYTSSSPSENTMFFILRNILCQKNGYCISNNFYYEIGSKDNEHIRINADGYIVFWLNISKLPSQDVEGLKQWLSQNPTTVYYELETPIITPIEPIEFNTSQGAVINISSDISPTSTHKVILNRAGQIEQGIELIANLKSRINNLERLYDSNLIATQYKLDNLKLNYELEREED